MAPNYYKLYVRLVLTNPVFVSFSTMLEDIEMGRGGHAVRDALAEMEDPMCTEQESSLLLRIAAHEFFHYVMYTTRSPRP